MGKTIAQILAAASLWSVVATMILVVEPALVRDILIDGVYLPFLLALFPATYYSAYLVTQSGRSSIMLALLSILAVFLALIQLFNYLIGFAIGGMMLTVSYFAIKKTRNDRLTSKD